MNEKNKYINKFVLYKVWTLIYMLFKSQLNKLNEENMLNKKGYSTGFTWVFGLVTLFGLGILYIVFSQVFTAHLVPLVKDMSNNSTYMGRNIPGETMVEIHGNIDKYMSFFNSLPFVLFFVVVIYMILAALRKEGGSEYG